MSKIGDILFDRIQKALKGQGSLQQPGRRCPRCDKDMSNYAFLFEPEPDDLCNECEHEVRLEREMERWRNAPLPIYDIDAIIGPPGRKSYEIVEDLYKVFYHVLCPEKVLYEVEVVIRDFCEFATFSGHSLGYILARNQGDTILLRGQRALRAIGADKLDRFISAFLEAAKGQGITFPSSLPDPWLEHIHIEYDLEKILNEESSRLQREMDPYEDKPAGYLHDLLMAYVMKNIEQLRQRKPQGV